MFAVDLGLLSDNFRPPASEYVDVSSTIKDMCNACRCCSDQFMIFRHDQVLTMTSRIPISFACGGYDRVEALRSGEVTAAGIALNFHTINHPRDVFDRMNAGEFDAAEMSASDYICSYAQGKRDVVAIPVFPSRMFRHGFIAVNADLVQSPKDLEGKRVGVQLPAMMTAAVWIRGLLAQHGVDLSTIEWVEGPFEGPAPAGKPSARLAGKITRNSDPSRGLSQLLADGEIAATIGAGLPASLGQAPNVRRLFQDSKEVEKTYYRKTGIFPIMHVVVIRRALVEAHPWLASSLFDALQKSKEIALRRMKFTISLRYMLPWLPSELDEIEEVFSSTNGDPWPYGLDANRTTLNKLIDDLHDQGMMDKKPALEELFWPVTPNKWNI